MNDSPGIRIEEVIVFLQSNVQCNTYFSNLQTSYGADESANLYRIQTKLLLELAEMDYKIDRQLEVIEKEKNEEYYSERGGEAKGCVVPGVLGLEEVKVPSSEEDDNDGKEERLEARRQEEVEASFEEQRSRRTKRAIKMRLRPKRAPVEDPECFMSGYERAKSGGGGSAKGQV